jgi:pyruvate/2-oxoglutarate dehydrogenase complex dihydrolipoamide acyltransferase (E2) component
VFRGIQRGAFSPGVAMPNLKLTKKRDLSSFRKISLGTWRTSYDPSVYGTMDIRMEKALAYLEDFRQRTGKRLTVTHLVVKAVAMALKEMPDANAILRWNNIYLRKDIGVFFQVAMTDEGPGRIDLSGVTIYDVEQKGLSGIVDEAHEKVEKVRARRDPALEKTRGAFKPIPALLMPLALRGISFLTYTLNLDLSGLGIPKDAFGSIMITNIGSLGLDVAYAPLVPYSRVPILLAMGAVKDAPVVDNGQLVPGKLMKINATFDHRFIDGAHAAIMAKVLRRWLENPEEHFRAVE